VSGDHRVRPSPRSLDLSWWQPDGEDIEYQVSVRVDDNMLGDLIYELISSPRRIVLRRGPLILELVDSQFVEPDVDAPIDDPEGNT
jgi:hypothetical protein